MIAMSFLGLNRAVPGASLLGRDDGASLGFETTSWLHLNSYVSKVESLPAASEPGSATSAAALLKLLSVVQDFGSPRQLHELVEARPGVLQEDQPPTSLYASVAWVVQHLQQSAASVVETLQNLPSGITSAGDVRRALQQLGSDAEHARRAIGPMVEALKSFKVAVVDANAALSAAYQTDAARLRQMQEDLGRLQSRADTVQKQIEQFGFFSAGKKHESERELETLKQQHAAFSIQSEKLRAALAAIEPIQNEGFWLQSGVDDLVGFLDKLRKMLTTFGSGMTQLAADGSDAQLQDAASMETILGGDDSIRQWSAIERAAARFIARSMINFPAPGAKDVQ